MILALIRATTFCPIGCKHCYLRPEIRNSKDILTEASLLKILDVITAAAETNNTKKIRIIWTGGEPLTIDANYYIEMGKVIDSHFANCDIEICESMQTSLLPIKPSHIDLFKKRFNSRVTSSIDFSQRTLQNNNASYLNEWLIHFKDVKESGIDIYTAITPTKSEIGRTKEIYNWLASNKITDTYFSPFIATGAHIPPSIIPSNTEQSHFFSGFFDIIMQSIKTSESVIYNEMIGKEIFRAIQPTDIQLKKLGCQNGALVFDPHGNINTCPCPTEPVKNIGNLCNSWEDILFSKTRQERILKQKIKLNSSNRCLNCEFLTQCKRGCIMLRNDDMSDDCAGFKTFLQHITCFCNTSEENKKIALRYADTACKKAAIKFHKT